MEAAVPYEGGRFRVEYDLVLGPQDHPIRRPRVTDERTGRVLLDTWDRDGWDWDAHVLGADEETLRLAVRRFPGTVSVTLVIDPDAGTFRYLAPVWRLGLRPLSARLRAAGLRRA